MRCNLLFAFIVMAIFAFTNSFAQKSGATFINQLSGTNDSIPSGYVPPLISNGSLSMLVDYQGSQSQKQYVLMNPVIYWAGRRYGPPNDALIPYGHFEQELTVNGKVYKTPTTWEQTLDTKTATLNLP